MRQRSTTWFKESRNTEHAKVDAEQHPQGERYHQARDSVLFPHSLLLQYVGASIYTETLDGQQTRHANGTTTAGESIILTSREVEKMKERYPNSALYVVYGIRLDKSKDPPVATFGSVKKKYPWEIKDNKLKAKDYYYET